MNTRYSIYTWSGNGNIGDDWLAEVGRLMLPSALPVRERRCPRPGCWGRWCLTDAHSVENRPLVLWGGGWLAADRPGSTTVSRWSRHFDSRTESIHGFGLGVGPFHQEEDEAARLLTAMSTLAVRTMSDANEATRLGASARLGSDAVFVDPRLNPAEMGEQRDDGSYSVISFPRFGAHWARERPWLTEPWYRSYVEESVHKLRNHGEVVFADFNPGGRFPGDAAYWRSLPISFADIKTPLDAISLIGGATSVVAGRLHAGIMAACLGKPVSALAYHPKFGALEEAGVSIDGLHSEPMIPSHPERPDAGALGSIRQRGMDALASMRYALV